MTYTFFKVTPENIRTSGTAPDFVLFIDAVGTDLIGQKPTVTEIATGVYTFTYAPTIQIIYEIDIGADIEGPARYLRGILDPSDNVAQQLDHIFVGSEVKKKEIIYATVAIPARNVGIGQPSYIKVDVNRDSEDYDFTTPDLTYYVVFEYKTIDDSIPYLQYINDTVPL